MHAHVVAFGEMAFEVLLERERISSSDVFKAGHRLFLQLAATIPSLEKASRLADFTPALPGTSS